VQRSKGIEQKHSNSTRFHLKCPEF
jgi:hypothetical protein